MTETQEYWARELDHFARAFEVNFNHFMGVFYFWVGMITIPATAGLLGKETIMTPVTFAALFGVLAVLGLFLTTKTYDIRCSQLRYTVLMNEARQYLYDEVKSKLPEGYKLPFGADTNLRTTALKDFGMMMAIVMSLINASYAYAAWTILGQTCLAFDLHSCLSPVVIFLVFLMGGLSVYVYLVLTRIPETRGSRNGNGAPKASEATRDSSSGASP
jgi:hypothetical protein